MKHWINRKLDAILWVCVWLAVVNSSSCKGVGVASEYADKCVEDYNNRFRHSMLVYADSEKALKLRSKRRKSL